MKTLLAIAIVTTAASTSFAQAPAPQPAPAPEDCCPPATQPPAPAQPPELMRPVAAAEPAGYMPSRQREQVDDSGWHAPVGRRLLHGFRLGYTFVQNADKPTRLDDTGEMVSIKEKFGLKTPHMMLIGYEGFYRIIGHSWLNVLMVGNVTVAGLEQSKFIPAASGLIGAEFNESFQVGVGVNVTPDPDAPTHMIAAVGWTPRVGAISTPVHFFVVPDTEGNHRWGGTVGVTW